MKDEIKKINLSEMLFNRDERLLDYITNLQKENMKYDQCLTELTDNYKDLQKELTNLQEEKDKYKLRCYKAKKMIFDNYGVLDKYGIEMLEDILDGKSDE